MSLNAPYAEADEIIAARLLSEAPLKSDAEARIDLTATRLIEAIRAPRKGLSNGWGGIEDFLREYSLSTKEGLALMVLAEALLRVPDAATSDKLIEDKLSHGDWGNHTAKSDALLVSASSWALGWTARVIQTGDSPEGLVANLTKRLGLPAVRAATRQAMRVIGGHFVLGQTIEEALNRGASGAGRLYRYSFDMLGEGARTQADAARYFNSYAKAIEAIGKAAGEKPLPDRPGISVKLSALHPRYEAISHQRVLRELTPQVIALAQKAKVYDLNFTVDAEEADRLELSLDVIEAVLADPSLKDWRGFGLAIQGYQKRAAAVVDLIVELAKKYDRKLMVRLVKGAYWDGEIKKAQEAGLSDYPVFSRKAMTDLNYLACAKKLLGQRERIYPQFATHNALSIASILELANDDVEGFEFQRLHGMGDALYNTLLKHNPKLHCRTYAPVGSHEDLLAYLVRRLLENGANSSFVSQSSDPDIPIAHLLIRPQKIIGDAESARQRNLPLPAQLYAPGRKNSEGVEFGNRCSLNQLLQSVAQIGSQFGKASSLLDGRPQVGTERTLLSPIDAASYGSVLEADETLVQHLLQSATKGFRAWAKTSLERRADCLDRMADLLESERAKLLSLLQIEAGKTLDDALAEWREAIDFCRYYAMQARINLIPMELPGPTGESNRLLYRGRGVFVCISPWNFPLAIFLGQICAALVTGNAVIAKPAEATPMIAWEAVRLLHRAGVTENALQLALGDGAVGGFLVSAPSIAGVAFTGSTATAWAINRRLAQKEAAIVPLIAETGGINSMIVDATALPEQVCDDVLRSAFRSTGQRCSALRLLCVQTDIADKLITMLVGAVKELKLGDPRDISVHIGPVIDTAAKKRLDDHCIFMRTSAKTHYAGTAPQGHYVAPHIFEIDLVEALTKEVFGPVLHIVRYKTEDLDNILDAIEQSGFGLTLGIHSRVDSTVNAICQRLNVGNCYVNRNMIGAIVGTQPFGGFALSGTGPKAGGPNYLHRFASEQVVTVNTAAAGGNASLIAGTDGTI